MKLIYPPQFEIPQDLEVFVHEYGIPHRTWTGTRAFAKACNFTGKIKLIHPVDGSTVIYKYKDGNPVYGPG
jgi:hypothetical protein